MTTNPNLSDLIKRNAALEKENATLRQELATLRGNQMIRPRNENRPIDYLQVNVIEAPKTLSAYAIKWAAECWDGHKLFKPNEIYKLSDDNDFFEPNLASREGMRIYQLKPEHDTKENWQAIKQAHEELTVEATKPFSVHRIEHNGYRPDAVHFGIEAMPSILEVLRHIESKQWWILRNSDSVMIAQSKD